MTRRGRRHGYCSICAEISLHIPGLAALILFLGISAAAVMPIDIFPEINIPVVTVIWQYTGLSTPEMEQRVTTYGEYAISTSVSGIETWKRRR